MEGNEVRRKYFEPSIPRGNFFQLVDNNVTIISSKACNPSPTSSEIKFTPRVHIYMKIINGKINA